MAETPSDRVTAAVLIIGDEILSGRTQDTNLRDIAKYLGVHGIDLAEARTVPDVHEEIIAALDALRTRYDYVITTGGIGPTHDDITADAVAAAFGVELYAHPAMSLGSYPFFNEGVYGSNLVLRGRDPNEVAATVGELIAALEDAGVTNAREVQAA